MPNTCVLSGDCIILLLHDLFDSIADFYKDPSQFALVTYLSIIWILTFSVDIMKIGRISSAKANIGNNQLVDIILEQLPPKGDRVII
jgi:hypothetical protein